MISIENEHQKNWGTYTQEQKDSIIGNYILNFADIPYERELEERALYPFSTLNYLTGGIERGEMTIIAGETGGGKSTFVSQCVGQFIDDGDKCMCIYGESTLKKQTDATYRQYVPYDKYGYEYIQYKKNNKATPIGQYFVNKDGEEKVKQKTDGKLYYYKTTLGMTVPMIIDVIDYCYRELDINYFVVDNLMQIETATENEVKEIKDSIELFRQYVISHNIAIIFVAHYRKTLEGGQIRRRLEEIAGTSAIGNKMATAINIIRLDNVDKNSKQYKSLASICEANNQPIDNAMAVVEVLKTRFNKLGFVALGYNRINNIYYQLHEYKNDKDKEPVLQDQKKSIEEIDFDDMSWDNLTEVENDGNLPF